MKNIILVMAVAFLTCGAAHAQVRKCIGSDGKVTYSDFVCAANTAKETGITTNANTIDASGMRQDANRIRVNEAVEKALREKSGQCRFQYYANGDAIGQSLAEAATQECLANIKARVTGQETSLEAYTRWNDHAGRKDATRQAELTRAENAANAANAQAVANSNQKAINKLTRQINNKTYNCQPNLMGNALECR